MGYKKISIRREFIVNAEKFARFAVAATIITGLLVFPLAFPRIVTAADFPEQRGYVNDFAGKLPEAMKKNLEVSLATYHQKHNVEIVVAVIAKESFIPGYADKLSAAWKIGNKEKDRGGCLVVIFSDGTEPELSIPRLVSDRYEKDEIMEALRLAIAEPISDKDIPQITIRSLATLMDILRSPDRLADVLH